MRQKRWWLAPVYVLATLLAQGLHDHGEATEESAVPAGFVCDESRTHLHGYTASPVHKPDHCLACQFRSEHQAGASIPPVPPHPHSEHRSTERDLLLSGSFLLRPTCRAPPLA